MEKWERQGETDLLLLFLCINLLHCNVRGYEPKVTRS